MNKSDIKKMVGEYGTQGDFAAALSKQAGVEISQQSVSQWLVRGSIPVHQCGHIEALTGGKWPAHVIRPDVFPSPA